MNQAQLDQLNIGTVSRVLTQCFQQCVKNFAKDEILDHESKCVQSCAQTKYRQAQKMLRIIQEL